MNRIIAGALTGDYFVFEKRNKNEDYADTIFYCV